MSFPWGAVGGVVGSVVDNIMGSNAAEDAWNRQKEAMRHGIRWRVRDAQKAGVHPIYALGANIPAASAPMAITGNFGAAGQDLGRSIEAMMSPGEKMTEYTRTIQALQLENMSLQNEALAAQISRIKQPGNPPAVANAAVGDRYLVDGQGSAVSNTLVKEVPLERTVSDPVNRHQEPGAIPDLGFTRTAAGGLYPVPSLDVKQRIEDNIFQEGAHFMRNMSGGTPPYKAPVGKEWWFHPIDGYFLRTKRSKNVYEIRPTRGGDGLYHVPLRAF